MAPYSFPGTYVELRELGVGDHEAPNMAHG